MRASMAMLEKEWLENRVVLYIPLFVMICGLALFASLLTNATIQHNLFFELSFGDNSGPFDLELNDSLNTLVMGGAGLVSLILASLYFPKTLRKARQEGSLMFWRSMPVSDVKTLLVKLGFGLLAIPLVCSALVLAADLLLWLLNLSTDNQLNGLYKQVALSFVLMHWLEFILRMALVGVLVMPLALTAMAISQRVNSPILVMVVAIYALKWMSIGLFDFYGISDFFTAIFALPMHALLGSNPLNAVAEAGAWNVSLYVITGVIAAITSLRLSKTVD